MLWISPASLRDRIVVPPTFLPKALPSHSRYVLTPSIVSFVKARESYMPPAVAAKKDAMASTPTQGPFMTEVSSTGFGAKAGGEFLRPISLNDGYPVFTWF